LKDEEVVRDDCGDMTPCRMLKSYQMYHGLRTVYVCFMHNTLSLKVFCFWGGANTS